MMVARTGYPSPEVKKEWLYFIMASELGIPPSEVDRMPATLVESFIILRNEQKKEEYRRSRKPRKRI